MHGTKTGLINDPVGIKILYLGAFGKHCSDNYRVKGFWQAGLDVKVIDFRDVFRISGDVGLKNYVLHELYSYDPDIVYVNKGEKFSPDILRQLNGVETKARWFLFYGDQRNDVPDFLKRQMKYYDAILVNSDDEDYKKQLMKYGAKKVLYHHTATDLEVFRKRNDIHERYDLVFFGGNYIQFPNSEFRRDLIRTLSKKYKIKVYGFNWGELSEHPVYGEDYSLAASEAKITIGVNAFNDINMYWSNRTWNSMACGFHLTHYSKGMENVFENGKHLVWFKTIGEAIELIDYYLAHIVKIRQIYNYGRELLVNHSYKARAIELIKIYGEIK